jgi:hypothetical protein
MCIGVKKYLLHEDMARVHIARRAQTRSAAMRDDTQTY